MTCKKGIKEKTAYDPSRIEWSIFTDSSGQKTNYQSSRRNFWTGLDGLISALGQVAVACLMGICAWAWVVILFGMVGPGR